MDSFAQLDYLVELAESLNMVIRRAPATSDDEHPGGAMIRLKGKEILFLDTSAAAADQIGVVASALAGRKELQDRFLPPEIRQVIESVKQ